MRKHILIAGTGRAGTSLLVRVLDACGLETEVSRRKGEVYWDHHANAGIESVPIVGSDHAYVVKSPWSYQFIRELLDRSDIALDCVVLPVRNLDEVTASRIVLELRHRYEHSGLAVSVEDTWRDWSTVPGGASYSLEPLDQARILAHPLHKIIEALTEREIPLLFLKFPKFAQDLPYLYRQLRQVLPPELGYDEFHKRVSPLMDGGKIRVTSELAQEETACTPSDVPDVRPGPHDAVELPSFDELDRIALKRELRSLKRQLREVTDECVQLRSGRRFVPKSNG